MAEHEHRWIEDHHGVDNDLRTVHVFCAVGGEDGVTRYEQYFYPDIPEGEEYAPMREDAWRRIPKRTFDKIRRDRAKQIEEAARSWVGNPYVDGADGVEAFQVPEAR